MSLINYTFIIPNKNLTKLLCRCLSSIPHREDVQIIVVDDNSDSNKVDFENYPGRNEPFTEVIFTKKGGGAGYARNVALRHAVGKWLIFLDSDDFLTDGAIEILDRHLEDNEDIVYFNVESVYTDDLSPSKLSSRRSLALARYKEVPLKIDLYCRYFYTQPWGKMVKRDFINKYNISFEESSVANDYWFSVVSGHYANSISYDDAVLYVYTERKGSLSNVLIRNEEVAKTRLEVYHKVQCFFDKEEISFIPFFELSLGLYRMNGKYRKLVKTYFKENKMSMQYLFYRYIRGKIFKFFIGVKE